MKNRTTPIPRIALVAGGAGFVGSHLCDRLIERGLRVICLDSLLTGTIDNIAALLNDRHFSFSAPPNRSVSTISAKASPMSGSPASSTPTAPACAPATVGWSPT